MSKDIPWLLMWREWGRSRLAIILRGTAAQVVGTLPYGYVQAPPANDP